MARQTQKKAVIYCRVSSAKQTTRGDGLSSQETRCREYAKYRGHEIVKVFKDDMSGSVVGRPGMQAMLAYLRAHRKSTPVVIIDDISRLARGLDAHLKLRAEISSVGGTLESPSIEFGEDSDSQLVEHLLASVSQHQRQKNGEQTMHRMHARVQNGFWVFQAPWGYRYAKAESGGKMLVRDEPLASIIAEAFESFASGRLASVGEVKRFFESHPEIPKCKYGYVLHERVHQVLTQPLYAGYVEAPRWKITRRKGQHEALVSLATFDRVQENLTGKPRAAARVDINEDFPLRGFVCCDDCGHPLTANWSKGEHKSYPYYLCRQAKCESRGKSIARGKVEGAFEELLQSLTPTREFFNLASAIFKDLWNAQSARGAERISNMKKEVAELERKVAQLLDRIVDSESKAVVAALEGRLEELEHRKHLLKEEIVKIGAPARDYDQTFRTAMAFLSNPWNLWRSDRLEDKRATLKLTFKDDLRYSRKEGFRTPETSFPFSMLADVLSLKREMAHPKRFELLTPRFVVWCSIQLSYGCACLAARAGL